jgi:hypothetical protein
VLAELTPAFAHREAEVSSVRGAGQPDSGSSSRRASARSMAREPGHTWPEVICCLCLGADCAFSRPSAPMKTTQYADLQHFLALFVNSDRAAAARLVPRRAVPASIQTTKLAYLQVVRETGATGLEPVTCGVTGRYGPYRHSRLRRGITD